MAGAVAAVSSHLRCKMCIRDSYYPSGLNSDEEQSMAYLPATGTSPKKQGVAYTYYEEMCIRDSF